MENRKPATLGQIWRVAAPVLLYFLISFAVSAFIMQRLMMQAGYAVLESALEQSDYLNYLNREYLGRTMEIVLLTCLLVIPLFVSMYLKDLRRQPGYQPGSFRIVLDLPALLWGTFASAMLALFLNNVLAVSPLVGWSPEYQEVSEAMYSGSIWMEIAASVIGASIAEELMMRGLVYRRLREISSARGAILCSALVFGIIHGNLVQGAYGFLMGLFLAWLMERFQTILLPILAHMAANLLLILMTESGALEQMGNHASLFLAVTLLGGVSFVRAFRVLRSEWQKREQQHNVEK